jgi:hypothetical protein
MLKELKQPLPQYLLNCDKQMAGSKFSEAL